MHLARFPRRRYTHAPTPIERLDRLTEHLSSGGRNGPEVFVKRDDLLGLTLGGNKTRKLEFLVADALARGADTLITVGAVQSNHCRLTLAAAVKEGLRCRLVLEERVPDSYREDGSGNNFLYRLLGVESVKVVKGGADLAAAMQEVADELAADGRTGYVIPGGGSNALGALGYVACAEEILAQTFESGTAFDRLVCASGSGGTHAGLVTGLAGCSANLPVTGISVRAKAEPQAAKLHALANDIAKLLGMRSEVPREAFEVHDGYVGAGYSLPTDAMVEAVQTLARLEGILLDPVYTGKAMAGFLDLARGGAFDGERVLFLHTGGSPALFAYEDVVLG